MTEKNACYTVGIAGASKVARGQHLPVIAENPGFTDINALSIVSEETRT